MLNYLEEHIKILKLAIAGKLPAYIDSKGDLPIEIIKELFEEGFLEGADATACVDGTKYLDLRITLSGREYLLELEKRKLDSSFWNKSITFFQKFFWWILAILGSVIAGIIVFHLTKK